MQTWVLEQMNISEGTLSLFIIDAYSCMCMDNLGSQSSDKLQGHTSKETVKDCAITLNIPKILFQVFLLYSAKATQVFKKQQSKYILSYLTFSSKCFSLPQTFLETNKHMCLKHTLPGCPQCSFFCQE